MEIAGIPIGHGHPCRTIAELSNNHNGKYENAVKLLNAAKAAGATFAKVQCYTPDELVLLRGDGMAPEPWGSQGWTMRRLYEQAATPRDWFAPLFAHAKRIGLPLFASVFGAESLALMELLDCPAYKIASLDRRAEWLWDAVFATGKPFLRSRPDYPDDDNCLYCPPGYPQERPALSAIGRGQDEYGVGWLGFSYHGTDPLVPVYAVVAGAHIVECHLQLDEEPSELEASVSLGATQFAYMVREIRKVEAML
jgi:sialic acid synthase SpsE